MWPVSQFDPTFRVGAVDPRVFGTFVEHMGRSVYTGIFEPGHPTADGYGFRGDVADLVRELGPTVARYPGGNFVSGYRWEDGVGPVEERPVRLDTAWQAIETNEVGLGGVHRAGAGTVGMEPMHGGQPRDSRCAGSDGPAGVLQPPRRYGALGPSTQARRTTTRSRSASGAWATSWTGPGSSAPRPLQEYGRLAAETARGMRMVDPQIELVACGSSNSQMPTFAAWEATVLEHCYELVDYISLHSYYDPLPRGLSTLPGQLARPRPLRSTRIVATADHVGARLKSPQAAAPLGRRVERLVPVALPRPRT